MIDVVGIQTGLYRSLEQGRVRFRGAVVRSTLLFCLPCNTRPPMLFLPPAVPLYSCVLAPFLSPMGAQANACAWSHDSLIVAQVSICTFLYLSALHDGLQGPHRLHRNILVPVAALPGLRVPMSYFLRFSTWARTARRFCLDLSWHPSSEADPAVRSFGHNSTVCCQSPSWTLRHCHERTTRRRQRYWRTSNGGPWTHTPRVTAPTACIVFSCPSVATPSHTLRQVSRPRRCSWTSLHVQMSTSVSLWTLI